MKTSGREDRLTAVEKASFASLIFLHIGLLGYSAVVHTPNVDEIAHVASGLSHWQTGDFSLYRVNPPFARLVASLPVYLLEADDKWLQMYHSPGDFGRSEFTVGRIFTSEYGTRYFRWITWARWATIPFSVLGGIVCFLWARDLYGQRAAWLALWLWCFSPMVLAYGAVVTPDVPSAGAGALAMYLFWRWLQDDDWAATYLAGVGLGLAELTKSTWIILPPLMVGLWFLSHTGKLRTSVYTAGERTSRRFTQHWLAGLFKLTALFLFAWMILMIGYGFQGAFHPLGKYEFQSELLRGEPYVATGERQIGNRFRGTWLESVPVPLPRQYVIGFDFHKADVRAGKKLAYLRGEFRDSGWWYYYLYALGVKCTIGGIALFLAATLYRLSSLGRWPHLGELVLLGPMLAVLVLLSYHTGLNKHSRYLLPLFPMAIVWSSQLASLSPSRKRHTTEVLLHEKSPNAHEICSHGRRRKSLNTLIALCAFAAAGSSLYHFPHSMSYFNEIVGGPENGYLHLSNSNVDWGQDLYFLKREMARRGWTKIGLATTASYDASILGIDFFAPPGPTPVLDSANGMQASPIDQLQPGVYAISGCLLHGYPDSIPDGSGGLMFCDQDALTYFQGFEPIGMVGYSMLLYEISDEDIERLRR